jgi:glycosyltransferase involved in cell wall biosynthesis
MQTAAMSPNTPTIVAVSPIPLDRDSRTLKQTHSLAAIGYRSLVVAAGRLTEVSAGGEIPFTQEALFSAPSVTEHRMDRLRRANAPWLLHAGLFVGWLGVYGIRSILRPLWSLPHADLYILHECSTYPAVALRARLARARFIYDAHDFYSAIEPDARQAVFDRRFVAPFIRMLERRAMGRAAAVVTVSDGLAGCLSQAYGRPAFVIRNAHDARLDRQQVPGLRERFGLAGSELVLVTVGNAKRGQALAQAIAALARLPASVHWVFVGGGYETLLPLAQSQGVASRVHLTGRLRPDEIVPTLRDADAAVVLYYAYSDNYSHALPNGFFQAIAAGLPQIVPPLPDMRHIALEYGFGVEANPLDPSSLVAAIGGFVDNPDLRASLAKAAGVAYSNLHWSVEEARFLDVVRSILKMGPPALRRP